MSGPASLDVIGPDRLAGLLAGIPDDFRAAVRQHGDFWVCDRPDCREIGVMINQPW